MVAIWARVLALCAGWLAAACAALVASTLLGVSALPVWLASGGIWTCLMLME